MTKTTKPWPLNKKPMTFPTGTRDQLSEDAKVFYDRPSTFLLDRDFFAPRATSRYVSPADAKNYEITERDRAAAAELKALGLGYLDEKHKRVYLTKVHEKYTIAYGRGAYLGMVYVHGTFADYKQLLAVLVGCDVITHESNSNVMTSTVFDVRHEIATDVEHDASHTALIEIIPTGPALFRGFAATSLTGVLKSANLYPLGTNPLEQDDFDPSKLCDMENCKPHPFAPYQPPAVNIVMPKTFEEGVEANTFTTVELYPLRPVLLAAKQDKRIR